LIKTPVVTLLAWVAVLLAAAVFLIRGPLRATPHHAADYTAPYVSGRLWLRHQNPYDPATFLTTLRQAGASVDSNFANPSTTHSVYPPPSVLVLIPLSLLSWPAALATFTTISTIAYILSLVVLANLLPGSWRQPTKPAFLAIGLAFAPTHSSLHIANPSCLSASLLFLAIYLLLRKNPILPPSEFTSISTFDLSCKPNKINTINLPCVSGISSSDSALISILLALSLCLKPTQAPFILLYLLVIRSWRILLPTLATGFLVCVLSILPLLSQNPIWLTNLRQNLTYGFTDGTASLLPQNLTRLDRIDLQLPLYLTLRNPTTALLLASLVTLILLGLALLRLPRPATTGQHLLLLGALFAIGLLPTYQRFYSATLLLIPLLWALANLTSPVAAIRRIVYCLLGLSLIFLANTSVLQRRLGIAEQIADHHPLVANSLFAPHVCWIVLLIAILLVAAVRTDAPARPRYPR
jgi:hypothetical protein